MSAAPLSVSTARPRSLWTTAATVSYTHLSETVTNENELLNDYTIKDADAGFDDPPVLEDDNSGSAAPASDEVDF